MAASLGGGRAGLCNHAAGRIRRTEARGRADDRPGPRSAAGGGKPKMMTWTAFSFLITGVLLNAGAQLPLQAGPHAPSGITPPAENMAAPSAPTGPRPPL